MSELNDTATNIYNRLASAPTFHPAGADLFTDWNMQAGDVVTVKAGTDSYNVPIYNMRLHWAGDSKIEVESTGNPEREPLPAIKRREYASGASAYGGIKSLGGALATTASVLRSEISSSNSLIYTVVQQTETELRAEMHNIESDMHGEIVATAQSLRIDYSRAESQIYSTINVTADSLRVEYSNAESGLYSSIQITAESIRAEVHTADSLLQSEIVQNASQIALRVKSSELTTELDIQLGNVIVRGGNLIVEGYITSDGLVTTMGSFSGSIYASGSIGTPSSMAAASITLDGESLTSKVMSLSTALWTVAADGDIDLTHYHQCSVDSAGKVSFGAPQLTQPAPFDLADTQYYKDGVAAVTLKSQTPYTWTNGVYLSNLGAVSATVTANLTNNKTPSGAVLIPVSIPSGPTVSGAYVSDFSVANVVPQTGNKYKVTANIWVKVRMSDNTESGPYGPYHPQDTYDPN